MQQDRQWGAYSKPQVDVVCGRHDGLGIARVAHFVVDGQLLARGRGESRPVGIKGVRYLVIG